MSLPFLQEFFLLFFTIATFFFSSNVVKINYGCCVNREVKHDVNGRRQTAKITSDFESFSSKPETKHTEME